MFWSAARRAHLSLGALWPGSAGEVAVRGVTALWQEDKDVPEASSWTWGCTQLLVAAVRRPED